MLDDTEEIVRTLPPSKRRIDAFTAPAEGYGMDYLSGLPPEVVHEILSYLILDHEPERAARLYASEKAAIEKAVAARTALLQAATEQAARAKDTGDRVDGEDAKDEQVISENVIKEQVARKKVANERAADDAEVLEVINYEPAPHVLLSLAAMSTHFRDQVESFSLHHFTTYKDTYRFKTTAERDELYPPKIVRRSERLKSKPIVDNRCYRMELVRYLRWHCISCNQWTSRHASMANGVACHSQCEYKAFPGQMTMSEAMEQYDLRDWMIIASRKPGPRAKLSKADLPVITYGAIRTGKPFMNGQCTSYRVYRRDVEKVAAAVHGNFKEHMKKKNEQRWRRKLERRDKEHRKLKIRYHEDELEFGELSMRERKWHRKRLEFYQDPNCKEGYGESTESRYHPDTSDDIFEDESLGPGFNFNVFDEEDEYGYYEDVHKRLCIEPGCDICLEDNMQKYCPWYA